MKVIEEYGLKIEKNSMFLGNLHKLMSIILYLDNQRDESVIHFKLAKKYFEKDSNKSTLG